ncbi:MAG TPA: YbaB/EbfC family nucleoid-associated protein [Actinomycetota bacterium]|nr:YbaB/EbfC family nucleoid-associated protein [Actinomycetota bacterium]
MQRMMREAQKMAAEVAKAQEELAGVEVEGTAGGGAVKVVATADQHIVSVTLDPELLSDLQDDADMIGDVIVTAVNDALDKAREKQEQTLGPLAGGLGGLGLPG